MDKSLTKPLLEDEESSPPTNVLPKEPDPILSEDSEDEEVEKSAQKKDEKKEEEKTPGCFTELKEFLKERYERTIFKQMDKFFDDEGYMKVVTNLPPLAKDFQPSYHLNNFNEKWKEITKEGLPKSQREDNQLIEELSNKTNRKVNLLRIISRSVKKDFYWAVFFKILMRIATISLPYVMKEYLKDIKSFKDVPLLESIGWCLLAGLLTFWGQVWGQLSLRWSSPTRIRAIEMLRDSMYIHIMDSNIDFLSQADSSFLSKLMLYESAPIESFVDAVIDLTASPIPIVFAFVVIILEFETNLYSLLIFGFFGILGIVIYFLHTASIASKKKVRTYGSLCTGEVEELTSEVKFIRANSLQKHLLRQIWKFRNIQVQMLKKIHGFEAAFNFLFSSPVIAGSLLLLSNQNSANEFDAVTVFAIISTVGSLKLLLSNLSNALSNYQDFKPAYELFNLYFNHISRSPRVSVFESIEKSKKSEKKEILRIQAPDKMGKKEAEIEAGKVQEREFEAAVVLDGCSFMDRKKKTKEFLDVIFNEDFMGEATSLEIEKELFISLEGITVNLRKGHKVCVMGEENSGFQVFLEALSNEHELIKGLLLVKGTLIHFDKKRFSLLDLSILENIVLDRKVRRKKLDKILASLKISLEQFVGGERGTLKDNPNMTDNQKVKILLARALYSDFDTIVISNFFDLLALDEKVVMFDMIVKGYLSLNTVIYHSNDRTLIDRADYVLVFDGGKIVQQGRPKELEGQGIFQDLTHSQNVNQGQLKIMKSKLEGRRLARRKAIFGMEEAEAASLKFMHQKMVRGRLYSIFSVILFLKRVVKLRLKKIGPSEKLPERIYTESTTGSIFKFLKLHSRFTPIFIVILSLASGFLVFAFDSWLGYWSATRRKNTEQINRRYFRILIILSVSSGLYNLLSDVLFSAIMRNISNQMFFASVKRIVKADIKWFDKLTIPLIIYNITHYQIMMDDEFSYRITKIANNLIMVIVAFMVANICFPGYFALVSVVVIVYMVRTVRRVVRTLEVTIPNNFQGRIDWFECYTQCLNHSVAMRYVNRPRYLFRGFELAVWKAEANRPMQANTSGRYIGFRAALSSSILIFSIYLCPVFIYHTRIYDYSKMLWVLSIALIWAGRTAQYLEGFMGNIVGLLIAVEGGERLWKLQMGDEEGNGGGMKAKTKNIIEQLLEEEELSSNRLTFTNEPPFNPKYIEVLEMKDVSFREGKQIFLDGICLEVDREDKVALMQQKGQSISILFDLLLGMNRIPKDQRNLTNDWTFKFFEKNIEYIEMEKMKDSIVYLKADPPLFSGTWRDNIDPNRNFKEKEIIGVLCALGFDKAYKERKEFNMKGASHHTTFSRVNHKLFSTGYSSFKGFSDDNQGDKRYIKSKKIVFYSKIFLLLIQWKKDAVKNQEKIREDKLLEQEILGEGMEEGPLLGKSSLQKKVILDKILPKADPDARELIEKILDTEVERQYHTLFIKRLVSLSRALLTRPDLVIVDEDSFITSLDQNEVDSVLDISLLIFNKSTILCKITSFKLVHRFTKCAIFDETKVKRYGFAEDIIRDMKEDSPVYKQN